jgi:uncharacterized protein YuzE
MKESEAKNILAALKNVPGSHMTNVHIRYDAGADTLYIGFGPPVSADDSELGDDDILYRYKHGELAGITATHFTRR